MLLILCIIEWFVAKRLLLLSTPPDVPLILLLKQGLVKAITMFNLKR